MFPMIEMHSRQKSAPAPVAGRTRKNPVFKIGAFRALLPCLLLLLTLSVSAQKQSGQISGTITDPNGAAVGNATITATDVGTNSQRTVTTSADGVYTVPDLTIGIYRVAVAVTGFKESIAQNVTVNVATITRQDFKLEVGQANEVVTIEADQIQVETQTGSVGDVVNGQQVRELPLNGRSFVQLTQLAPGVSAQNNFDSKNKGLFSGVDFSVNGNSAQSNLFLTDGANNNDTGSNRTILLYPSIEAIAEFKMLRNSYGPEYGQAAGSVISIVTRGGENKFHGSAFYFGRNDALNATNFYTNRSGLPTDKLRRNDYGFSLGGPIRKDKLFFFYSQEWNKEIRGGVRSGSVPTLAERSGDFSNSRIRASDGFRCDGSPIGNTRPGSATQVIPQTNLSPAGQLLVKLYPLPNLAWSPSSSNCNNWAISADAPVNFREENVRIDYNLNKSNKIFGRYTQDHWSNPSPIAFGAGLWGDDPFPAVESAWTQPSRQAAFKLTSTLSNTAVNEVQFSYSANRINVTAGSGADINQQINTAIQGFFPDSGKVNGVNRPHPIFWGGIAPFTSDQAGGNLWTEAPFKNSLDIYSVRDDLSKVWGNHVFKTGFLFDKAAKNEDSGPGNESPAFWGAPGTVNIGTQQNVPNGSGNYLADILTRGTYFGFGESDKEAVAHTRYTNFELYLGDSWKVRPNVTLELGARYSILFEPYDKNNTISSFDPNLYVASRPASDPCNGLVVPKGTNPCAGIAGASTPAQFSNRSLRKNNYKNFAPRLGVAWDVFKNGKTAVRGGFGQFFLRERVSPVVASLTSNSPFIKSTGGERTLDGRDFLDVPVTASNGVPSRAFSPGAETPYSLQFNVSIGQELWKGGVLELGYVGNRARNQLTHFDLNEVLPQNRVNAAFAGNGNAVNAFRPYSNYGNIYEFTRDGRANYDSLQVLFRTRFNRNSQFQAAYTFSKSLADFGLSDSSGGPSGFALQDPNNPGLDYGPSDINRPHIFVANAVVNLPSFKGSNQIVRTIIGGWEFTTIAQFASGTSLTPVLNSGGVNGYAPNNGTITFAGGISGIGTSQANERPNRVAGVSCTVDNNGDQGTQFINPAAFTLVGLRIGELGNSGRGSCLGSPTKNVDLSFYKNFSPKWLTKSFIGEAAKIQFRMEFFNVFNTSQFRGDSIGTTFYDGRVVCGSLATPCSPTNNLITGIVNGDGTPATPNLNFGTAGNTRSAREIQYALKLTF